MVAPGMALVLWKPEDVAEFTNELIPAVEQMRVKKRTRKAAQAELPAKLIKEIEDDSRWDAATKSTLAVSLPRLGAKWLNIAGVSAAYRDEIAVGICLTKLLNQDSKLDRKLDVIIAQNEARKKSEPGKTGP